MNFFLTIIGIDIYILDSTKTEKRTVFVWAGITTCLLFCLSIMSSYYMMTYLVKDYILDAVIALLFSTVLFNFYRFTISSIMWRSKKVEIPTDVRSPALSSTIIKLLTCGFFIIIVSKPIELWIFHSGIESVFGSQTETKQLYKYFFFLHSHFPVTWVITVFILSAFLWPICFSSFIKKYGNKEYESKHYETMIGMVRTNFVWFEESYNDIFRNKHKIHCAFSYEERYYDEEHNVSNRKLVIYSAYRTQFANPPFNTILKEKIVNTKGKSMKHGTSKEFFDLIDQLPIQSK